MPEARQSMNQSMEIREGGGSWIRRDFYPASRLRSRQGQAPTTDNKENILPPGTRVRSKRSPLPHWYPRTPLRDVTIVVHALERRRKRLRAVAAAQRRNPTNPEEPSSISSSSSPAAAEMNTSVHNTPGSQEVDLLSSGDASPPIVASPSSVFSPSTPQQNLCLVSHSPKEDDPKTAELERKLESTILGLEKLLVFNNSKKAPSTSRGGTRQLMSMR